MLSPSSILRWDSNPQPSEHESPPITTRRGLPPTRFLPCAAFELSKVNKLLKLLSYCFSFTHFSFGKIVKDKCNAGNQNCKLELRNYYRGVGVSHVANCIIAL